MIGTDEYGRILISRIQRLKFYSAKLNYSKKVFRSEMCHNTQVLSFVQNQFFIALTPDELREALV